VNELLTGRISKDGVRKIKNVKCIITSPKNNGCCKNYYTLYLSSKLVLK
jgi:hypothetical protein